MIREERMPRPRRLHLIVFPLAAALGLGFGSCRNDLKVTLATPASPAKGTVAVSFTLSDSKSRLAAVTLEYSTDDGATYLPATTAGKTSGLATGSGTTHSIGWDSLADLGATKKAVALKIAASNSDGPGGSATSGAFLADNSTGSDNLPPTLAIGDPAGEPSPDSILPAATYHGHLLVTFTLADPESDKSSVSVEFSPDGGKSFLTATSADGSSLAGLLAPKAGKTYTFLWDSKADLGSVKKSDVLLRLIPSDGKPGAAAKTGYLPLDNTELVNERGPYLQLVTPSSVLVVWTTGARTTTTLAWGPTPELGSVTSKKESATVHVAELVGLAPGTTYHYKAVSSGTALAGSKFRTSPPPGTPFTFVAFGDCGGGGIAQHTLADKMLALEPDLAVITGDLVYPAGEDYDYTAKFFTPYKKLAARTVFFPSLGNHDHSTASGAAYLKNFHLPTNNPEKSERYYSFDYGDVHFVALDSNLDLSPASPQGKWLAEDLAKTTQAWKIVYWHVPMYSSGEHGSSAGVKAALSDVLTKHGVELVLVGHDHNYERTKPVDGIVHIVTGGGGKSIRSVGKSDFTAYSRSIFHFLHVKVSPAKLEIAAVDMDGKVFDSHVISK